MKLLIMQISPASYHFLPLRPKYSPQYPVLISLKICDKNGYLMKCTRMVAGAMKMVGTSY
jgi:hypothetical protein